MASKVGAVLSAAQIRAARGLLDWTREQLVAASGVSMSALTKIEGSKSSPQAETLASIKRALENAGVVFGDSDGVKLKHEIVRVYEGWDGYKEFLNEVYYVMAQHGGEIVTCGGYEKDYFNNNLQEFTQLHIQRMAQLPNFTFRAITSAKNRMAKSAGYIQFRYLPDDMYFQLPFYKFYDRLAIMFFEPAPRFVVLQDAQAADAYNHQFELMWRIARRQPEGANNE